MADNQAAAGLTIPPELREKFGDLINFILGSESMNNEERQYWINILPVMTPDQITNLQGILTNEKQQLEKIDKKYANEIRQIDQEELVRKTGDERKKRRDERKEKEMIAASKEEATEEDLLKQIDTL